MLKLLCSFLHGPQMIICFFYGFLLYPSLSHIFISPGSCHTEYLRLASLWHEHVRAFRPLCACRTKAARARAWAASEIGSRVSAYACTHRGRLEAALSRRGASWGGYVLRGVSILSDFCRAGARIGSRLLYLYISSDAA